MLRKTFPGPCFIRTESGNINVCTCDGYKPTRREYFTALALTQVTSWVETTQLTKYGQPRFDPKEEIARAAVDLADELIKALDETD